MNALLRCLSIAMCLVAGPGQAEEERLSRLVDSVLFKNLLDQGIWSADVTQTSIEYRCLACQNAVAARLEIISPYTKASFASPRSRFLAERKVFCARLVTEPDGRCLNFFPVSMRGGALKGLQAEHEVHGQRQIQIVFFVNEQPLGPELIQATIFANAGTELPSDTIEMFRWHMARLTAIW